MGCGAAGVGVAPIVFLIVSPCLVMDDRLTARSGQEGDDAAKLGTGAGAHTQEG